MALVIPIQPIPNQLVAATLDGQPTKIAIYQKSTGLYVDVYKNDALVIGGVIALTGVRIIRDSYFGFLGDFLFTNTKPSDASDPVYTGLGDQYLMMYLEAAELPRDD